MTPNSYAETHDDEESCDSVSESLQSTRVDQTPTPSTRRNSSIGINSNISSVGSVRSLISTRSSLFPLVEEDAQDDDESSQSQTVHNEDESLMSLSQTVGSRGTSFSRSRTGKSQTVLSEESSQLHSNDEESSISRSQTLLSEETQLVQDYEESSQSQYSNEGTSKTLKKRRTRVSSQDDVDEDVAAVVESPIGSTINEKYLRANYEEETYTYSQNAVVIMRK